MEIGGKVWHLVKNRPHDLKLMLLCWSMLLVYLQLNLCAFCILATLTTYSVVESYHEVIFPKGLLKIVDKFIEGQWMEATALCFKYGKHHLAKLLIVWLPANCKGILDFVFKLEDWIIKEHTFEPDKKLQASQEKVMERTLKVESLAEQTLEISQMRGEFQDKLIDEMAVQIENNKRRMKELGIE